MKDIHAHSIRVMKKAVKQYLLSTVDFCCPESWIGTDLLDEDRNEFENCKMLIEQFNSLKVNHGLLMQISDKITIIGSFNII